MKNYCIQTLIRFLLLSHLLPSNQQLLFSAHLPSSTNHLAQLWEEALCFSLSLPEPLSLSFWFQAPQLYPQLHIHSPQIIHHVSQHLYLNPDRFSGQICTIAVVMQKNSNTWATKTKRTKQLVDCFFKNCLLRDKMRYFLWPSMCWIKNQTIKTAVWLLFI